MVFTFLGVWNGGGVCCCCPARCSGAARALLIPLQCWRVLLSCRALFLAGCVVCGWWARVCAVRGVGHPLRPLLAVVVGGAVVDGGACCEEGRRIEGGAGAIALTLPSVIGVPLLVRMVVLLNGGSGVSLCCPLLALPLGPFMVFPNTIRVVVRISVVCVL